MPKIAILSQDIESVLLDELFPRETPVQSDFIYTEYEKNDYYPIRFNYVYPTSTLIDNTDVEGYGTIIFDTNNGVGNGPNDGIDVTGANYLFVLTSNLPSNEYYVHSSEITGSSYDTIHPLKVRGKEDQLVSTITSGHVLFKYEAGIYVQAYDTSIGARVNTGDPSRALNTPLIYSDGFSDSIKIWTTDMTEDTWSLKQTISTFPLTAKGLKEGYYYRFADDNIYQLKETNTLKYVETTWMNTRDDAGKAGSSGPEFFTGRYNEEFKPIYGRYFYFPSYSKYSSKTTRESVSLSDYHIEKIYGVEPVWRNTKPAGVNVDQGIWVNQILPMDYVMSGNRDMGGRCQAFASPSQLTVIRARDKFLNSSDNLYFTEYADKTTYTYDVWGFECSVLVTYTRHA